MRAGGSKGAISRRQLLRSVALLGGGALVTRCRGGEVGQDSTHTGFSEQPAGSEPPPLARDLGVDSDIRLTATGAFFTMTYHPVPPPTIDPESYRLSVDGLVESPQELSLTAVESLPSATIMRTLACISNPVGGDLIGNAVWTGCRLSDVLESAGLHPDATEIRLESADGYHTGVTTELALDPNSLLAYRMNGSALPSKHGFPLRCLFPGRYGQKQPKWLSSVTVQDTRHKGHWESQGWSDRAPILIQSRFDLPAHRATVAAPVVVEGIAFSDMSGIASVDLIVDNEETHSAELKKVHSPFADLVWTEWTWTWVDPAPGDHTLLAKAVDGNGRSQGRDRPNLRQGQFPDGTSAMHELRLFVGE